MDNVHSYSLNSATLSKKYYLVCTHDALYQDQQFSYSVFQMLLPHKPPLSRWEVVCDLRFAKRNKQSDFMAFDTGCSYPPEIVGKIATLERNILIYRGTPNDLKFGRGEVGCRRVGS